MPLPKSTRYRYRKLPFKEGHERRQRLAFAPSNKIIEIKTERKIKGEWTDVKGNEKNRGYTRKL